MTVLYWVDDLADGDFHGATNWSTTSGGTGTTSPGAGDDAILDGNGTSNCTLSAAASVNSIDVQAGYTGTFDLGGYDLSCGDGTFSGTGTVTGTGEIAASGDFDHFDQALNGTWTGTNIDLALSGTGKTWTTLYLGEVNDVSITGTITLSAVKGVDGTRGHIAGDLAISAAASLTISAGDDLRVYGIATIDGDMIVNVGGRYLGISEETTVAATGSMTGAGKYRGQNSKVRNDAGGLWDIAETDITFNSYVRAGTYGGSWHFLAAHASDRVHRLGEFGDITFSGPVLFDAEQAGNSLGIYLDNYDPTIYFEDDVQLTEVGSLVWIKSSTAGKKIVFSGTTDFDDDTGADLGEVEVTGSLTLDSDLECTDFTGTATGSLDPAGYDIEAAGNMEWEDGFAVSDPVGSIFSIDGNWTGAGQDLSGASAAWYLEAAGTAIASGAGAVAYCDASGGSQIKAAAYPWTDAGDNISWDFGLSPESITRRRPVRNAYAERRRRYLIDRAGWDLAEVWLPATITRRRPAPSYPRGDGPPRASAAYRGKWYGALRGCWRIFNTAGYRFYRGVSPPAEGDTPYATSSTLPATPADVFGNQVWYLSVSYFNGVIDSGFLPIGAHGETYLRLELVAGEEVPNPPEPPVDWRIVQTAGGVVRVLAVYADHTAAVRADTWALAYSVDGSTPAAAAPDVSPAMPAAGVAVLEYDLPAQGHGTVVKVRLQTAITADGGDIYSEGSTVKTATVDTAGPTAPTAADNVPGTPANANE